ncbi:MAG TPA: hypothetical protein VKH44_10745, partial [Pirellulaceae bacterium]|nr:hypothetical protein [Pirellulaceae bacterium]
MAKSLNPHAAALPPPPPARAMAVAPRRNVLAAVAATLIGGFISIVPFAAGLATFLDPLLRRKKGGGSGNERPPLRVASLEALP